MTGVLLIALNEAVKAMPLLMGLDKEYTGTMHLHKHCDKKIILKAFKEFTGKIIQTPPVRSRVSRKPRTRHIYSFKLLGMLGRNVKFKIRCEAGVYIRKLIHDVGENLGTGAHLKELRRTEVGCFSKKECVKMEHLEKHKEKSVVPLEYALGRIRAKKIVIKEGSKRKVMNGIPLKDSDISKMDKNIKENDIAGVFNEKGEIIALARYLKEKAKIERVFLA